MKNITFLLLGLLLGFTGVRAQDTGDIPIIELYFPGSGFRQYILDSIDLNHDEILSETERLQVSNIDMGVQNGYKGDWRDWPYYLYFYDEPDPLAGISLFPNLQSLNCRGCLSPWWGNGPQLSIGYCPNLITLDCSDNSLSGLDVSGCPNLQIIHCESNNFQSLDLNGCPLLQELHAIYNWELESLYIQNCSELKVLDCIYSPLSSLDLSNCPLLRYLRFKPYFHSLSLRNNTQLEYVDIAAGLLRSLDVQDLHSLKHLWLSGNFLSSLDLKGVQNLDTLDCRYNYLQALKNLQDCEKLSMLRCNENRLAYLDLKLPSLNLHTSNFDQNPFYYVNINARANYIVSKETYFVPRLSDTTCLLKHLPKLDLTNIGSFDEAGKFIPGKINGGIIADSIIIFREPRISYISPSAKCYIELEPEGISIFHAFSDPILVEWFNNKTGLSYLSTNYCDSLSSLSIAGEGSCHHAKDIETIDGLYNFPNLQTLKINNPQRLKFLNTKGCTKLQTLICNNGSLTGLDLSDTPELCSLSCQHNGRIIETDAKNRFDLKKLSHLTLSDIQNLRGGSIDENGILTFFQDTVWYEYPTNYTGANESIPQTLTFFLAQSHPNTPVVSDLPISQENFPDEKFRAYIQTHFDLDQNDSLSEMECLSVTEINVNKMGIKSLHGIQHFKNLKSLHADSNHLICLDLSCNTRLESVSCNGNRLTLKAKDGFSQLLERTNYPDFDAYHVWSITGGALYGGYVYQDEIGIQFDYLYDNSDGTMCFDSIITYEYRTNYRGGMVGPQLVTFQIINTYRPETSEQPEDPEAPENPDDDPEDPDDDPDNPENPGDDPDEPEEPENPTEPDTPDDPEDPDEPDTPDDPDVPDYPITANEYADATADLFSVHPVPFHNTLHIETELNLQSVCLYNMQGRLCARFEHGFDALPTAHLDPGLYLLLLETADGATYRLKAIKE